LYFQILEQIFQELPLVDLLGCRLVSRFWHIIGNSICRLRHVRFQRRYLHSTRTLADLNGTFRKSLFFPCSSYILNAVDEDDIACRLDTGRGIHMSHRRCENALTPIVVYNVMRIVGGTIRELDSNRFGNQFQCVLDGLGFTPNLEALSFCFWQQYYYPSTFHIPSVPTIRLPMLKSLKMESMFQAAHVQLLEFLIKKAGVRLEKIELGVMGVRQGLDESANEIPLLLTGIPSVALDFDYVGNFQLLEGFVTNPVWLKTFKICVSYHNFLSSPNYPFFRCLEKFLKSISESLETFHYLEYRKLNACTLLLKIPNLPRLKHLKIWTSGTKVMDLQPLVTNQFQELRNLQLVTDSPISFITLFDNSHFDSVHELSIIHHNWYHGNQEEETPEVEQWDRIFPNLKKLQCNINTHMFAYIVANLQKLESLTIDAFEEIQNLNTLLTGIPNLEQNSNETERIKNPRGLHVEYPSLLSFTGKVK